MKAPGPLLLTRSDVRSLLPLAECIEAVEEAFRLLGEGRTASPRSLGFPSNEAASTRRRRHSNGTRPYFAVKFNANFSGNPERFGLPAIQGVVLLSDGVDGRPLGSARLDRDHDPANRRGDGGGREAPGPLRFFRGRSADAATRGGSSSGRSLRVLPLSPGERLGRRSGTGGAVRPRAPGRSSLADRAGPDLAAALAGSDVCVTCTPSREPFVRLEDLAPGTFLAAVGADSPDKQELDPRIVASVKVVADSLEQCAEMGEIHHAMRGGSSRSIGSTRSSQTSSSGAARAGSPRRRSSFSTAPEPRLEDVAAAIIVYERALAAGVGVSGRSPADPDRVRNGFVGRDAAAANASASVDSEQEAARIGRPAANRRLLQVLRGELLARVRVVAAQVLRGRFDAFERRPARPRRRRIAPAGRRSA